MMVTVMNIPKVSVVIPAHNAGHTIGMALSSMFAQTIADWEVIVVDDGSTDRTVDIIRSMGDARVRLLRQTQSGAAAARNQGLEVARGHYIGFLDSDDFLFPRYLETSLEALQASPPKTVVTNNAYFLTTEGINSRLIRHSHALPQTLGRQQDALLRNNFVSIMSVFPRTLVEDVGGFDSTLERAEDWDFWIRASLAGWKFTLQKRPIALINRTKETLTSATEKVSQSEAEILRNASESYALTRRQTRQISRRLSIGEPSELWSASNAAIQERDYPRAAALHWKATRLATRSPSPLLRAIAFRVAPRIIGKLKRRRLP